MPTLTPTIERAAASLERIEPCFAIMKMVAAMAMLTALSACNFHNAGTVDGPTPEQGWSLDLDPFGGPPVSQPEDQDAS